MIGDTSVPAKQVSFWFRSGDGTFKNTLEGKAQAAGSGYVNREYILISFYLFSSYPSLWVHKGCFADILFFSSSIL